MIIKDMDDINFVFDLSALMLPMTNDGKSQPTIYF